MTTEGSSELQNFTPHNHHPQLLDWLEDSFPFLPSFLEDEAYSLSSDLTSYDWWAPNPQDDPLLASSAVASPVGPNPTPSAPTETKPLVVAQFETSKKRKLPTNSGGSQRRRSAATDDTEGNNSSDNEIHRKPPITATGRKAKSGSTNVNGNNKEVRWAEQLLNPLAGAIDASNLSRIQHLLYVLQELASPTGDANHRLASHGFRALTRRIPTLASGDHIPSPPVFATAEPKLFRSALIKFHEVSPWFAFPNALANASILQTLSVTPKTLHVVDVGVSHGIQWPTLLEALTRRPGGTPPLIRLTIAENSLPAGPFSAAPPGYDSSSHLLRYSKLLDLNLQINHVKDLTPQSLSPSETETLVICAQFRANHGDSDKKAEFLRSAREMNPDLLILTEIDGSGLGFARRAEVLWRFLDSTSAAFKGRECEERRVMEGEMARVLEEGGEGFGEGREQWAERILGLGFRELGFGDEAVEAGRALLRKYDGNWEMRMVERAVGLWWKGQPVSFCSLWKTG